AAAAPDAAARLDRAAPPITSVLRTRYPGDYASLLTQAAAGVPPGVLLLGEVRRVKQTHGDTVIHAPEASLRALIGADHALVQAAATHDASLCPALITGPIPPLPDGPVTEAYEGRTAALLTAIADARDHPVTERRANPDDYKAFTAAAKRSGVGVAGWAVLAPTNLGAAKPEDVCRALLSVDATVLAMHDDVADRVLSDLAATLASQQGR
ncbi:hypothetical protein, partial [Acidisphaera rubrifaciens]|uniref:hypothetical protein n=1 Tax=Acidisphaera rubrifaciens TaxID=50715 RepID=UPI0006628A1D